MNPSEPTKNPTNGAQLDLVDQFYKKKTFKMDSIKRITSKGFSPMKVLKKRTSIKEGLERVFYKRKTFNRSINKMKTLKSVL